MLTLSTQMLTIWTRSLFHRKPKPARVNRYQRERELEREAAENARAFITLFDALDNDSVYALYLTLKLYHAKMFDADSTVAWLAELSRYTDIEQAYQIALQRYAQKGET